MNWFRRLIRRWGDNGTFILLVLFLALLAVLTGIIRSEPEGPDLDEAVVWKEAQIEALVREALNKPEGVITPRDLRDISLLNVSEMQLRSVEDIAYFPVLDYLDISNNQITDISPLFTINPDYINLANNEITSIKGIFRMTRLHGLDISHNPVNDISDLCRLEELFELTMSPSHLKNENPLRWMKNLYNLELTEPLKDEKIISDLTKLKRYLVAGEDQGIFYDYNEKSWLHHALKTEEYWGSRANCDVKSRIGIMTLATAGSGGEGEVPRRRKNQIYIEFDIERMLDKNTWRQEQPFLKKAGRILSDYPVQTSLILVLILTAAGGVYIFWELETQKKENVLAEKRHFGAYVTRDVTAFVGDGAEYYLYRFSRVREGKPVFHVCAVLFGTNWIAYRLMWKEALVISFFIIGGSALLDRAAICNAGGLGGTVVWQITGILYRLLCFLFYGFFADRLYWKYVKTGLNRCGCQYKSAACPEAGNEGLEERTGTSWINGFLMLGVTGSMLIIIGWLNRIL
ncbi:DUF2628 domain-containing protein [Hungatella hathewayi]|uniref:DUF2628 domain-containing protein n=1 Tax=Hungatella hathewayi TaxID=154046 RepID=UPI003563D29E